MAGMSNGEVVDSCISLKSLGCNELQRREIKRGKTMDRNDTLEKLFDIHCRYSKEIKVLADQFYITGENGVLCHLHANGGRLSSGELAESMGLTSGRIANILKSLERKGLIQRKRDTKDKRHVIAVLTDHGRDRINDILEKNNEIIKEVLEQSSIQRVWEFLNTFEKLLNSFKKNFKND